MLMVYASTAVGKKGGVGKRDITGHYPVRVERRLIVDEVIFLRCNACNQIYQQTSKDAPRHYCGCGAKLKPIARIYHRDAALHIESVDDKEKEKS